MHTLNTHQPVLLQESLAALGLKPGGYYVDATFGRGGHSQAILDQLSDAGHLLVMDRDPQAIDHAQSKYADDQRVHIVAKNFDQILKARTDWGADIKLDGILFDLGVSSPQLDDAERGFSFMRDGPLDMRMNPNDKPSASEWIASVERDSLAQVLRDYGEERFARRIATAIVAHRKIESIDTTRQLAQIIADAVPKKDPHKHPATRSFQAIRIYINRELEQLRRALLDATSILRCGGRIVVISFHSLEDRIVKRFFRNASRPQLPPKKLPVSDDNYRTPMKRVGNAIRASDAEREQNPRSRSAVLRVAERTNSPFLAEVAYA